MRTSVRQDATLEHLGHPQAVRPRMPVGAEQPLGCSDQSSRAGHSSNAPPGFPASKHSLLAFHLKLLGCGGVGSGL